MPASVSVVAAIAGVLVLVSGVALGQGVAPSPPFQSAPSSSSQVSASAPLSVQNPEISVRLKSDSQAGAILVQLKNDLPGFPWKDLAVTVLTALTVTVAAVSMILTYRSNTRTLLQKLYEEEIKDNCERLNAFYGPVRQLLGTSKQLYELFQAHQPDRDNFRTLSALLNGTQFSGNDGVLLKQIIDVTGKIDELIMTKSALIDESLQPLLWKASTHFRMIRLAHQRELSGESDRFEAFIYPRELNEAIDKEIERLKTRNEELRALVAPLIRPRRTS